MKHSTEIRLKSVLLRLLCCHSRQLYRDTSVTDAGVMHTCWVIPTQISRLLPCGVQDAKGVLETNSSAEPPDLIWDDDDVLS